MDLDPAAHSGRARYCRRADRGMLRGGAACLTGRPTMKSGPVAITGLRTIVERFDHVLLDHWGTLHEGEAIFPEAYECVARLRETGKKVLVVSNSGKRANDNEQRLAALGLPPEAYDGVLSSG